MHRVSSKLTKILEKHGQGNNTVMKEEIWEAFQNAFPFKVTPESIEVTCKEFHYKLGKGVNPRNAELIIDGKATPFVSFKLEQSIPEIPIPEITLKLYPH